MTDSIDKGFRPESLVGRDEFAIERHGVVAGGAAGESGLAQTGLLALPPARHQGDDALVGRLSGREAQFFARVALKGPGAVAARSDVPSEADLFKVGHSVADGELLSAALAVSVQFVAAALQVEKLSQPECKFLMRIELIGHTWL